MQAYDEYDNLVEKLESKEGETVESFFDKCASIFEKEEVARMQIFKRRSAAEKKLEAIEKEDRIDRPYYRKNRF
jgi:hypothetical protein